MTRRLCGCGCGRQAPPRARFAHGHYRRVPCPRCGKLAAVRDDGAIGPHWAMKRDGVERARCTAGGVVRLAGPARSGRRVKVEIDAVLPDGMDVREFCLTAQSALRIALAEPFIVSVNARDDEVAS